jgi:hypothetical protein
VPVDLELPAAGLEAIQAAAHRSDPQGAEVIVGQGHDSIGAQAPALSRLMPEVLHLARDAVEHVDAAAPSAEP